MVVESVYSGRKLALLTQHGKEKWLAPVLEPGLGCQLVHVSHIDTDQLGTFSREIPRTRTQLDAARKKARIGMEATGLPLGLASEGAFGSDPVCGMLPWNVEYLVWIDDELGIEVLGRAQGAGCHAHMLTASWDQAVQFAQKIGFPAQQLILRPDHSEDPRIRKDIRTWTMLSSQFRALSELAATGQVFIESDGRAHANPMRQKMIGQAAEDLLFRLRTRCPSCGSPGFGVVEPIPGLPCAACDAPTSLPRADELACPRCAHRQARPRRDRETADPCHCPCCNP